MATADHPAHPGVVNAPAVPASNATLNNPFSHACLVQLTGGTVTAIQVGGVALGLLGGLVLVPAGSSIKLTYAVAPTWAWYGIP